MAADACLSIRCTAKESLREWVDRMKEQVKAQAEWADNMVWLAGNASAGVVGKFAERGAEGAPLLAELRDDTTGLLGEIEATFADTAAQSKLSMIESALAMQGIYPELVKRFGEKAAKELYASIDAGVTSVDRTLSVLKATHDGKIWRIGLDANTGRAANGGPPEDLLPGGRAFLEGRDPSGSNGVR